MPQALKWGAGGLQIPPERRWDKDLGCKAESSQGSGDHDEAGSRLHDEQCG